MNLKKALGISANGQEIDSRQDVVRYINLKLSALGCPWFNKGKYSDLGIAEEPAYLTTPIHQRIEEYKISSINILMILMAAPHNCLSLPLF